MAKKIDSKTESLDVYVYVAKTFADSPWLHYGLWEPGERPTVPKLRAAQERYVDKLLELIPPVPQKVFDIGGGTGAMARLLIEKGYVVDMLTPSPVQAGVARERLGPNAHVFEQRFEDFAGAGPYDVCLFSESFQYVDLDESLVLLDRILAPDGRIVIADCFRGPNYQGGRQPGGGHKYSVFLDKIAEYGFAVEEDHDVTEAAAQSMAIDQNFYRGFTAPAIEQLRGVMAAKKPVLYWFLRQGYKLFVPKKERENIVMRLKADYRSPEAFTAVNTYRFLSLKRHNRA